MNKCSKISCSYNDNGEGNHCTQRYNVMDCEEYRVFMRRQQVAIPKRKEINCTNSTCVCYNEDTSYHCRIRDNIQACPDYITFMRNHRAAYGHAGLGKSAEDSKEALDILCSRIKEIPETHELTMTISLIEIVGRNPCLGELIKFLAEFQQAALELDLSFLSNIALMPQSKLSNYPTLLRNIDWINSKFPGAIVEKKKKKKAEILLRQGMKVKCSNGNKYIIDENQRFVNIKSGKHLAFSTNTLEKLNAYYIDTPFKILLGGN